MLFRLKAPNQKLVDEAYDSHIKQKDIVRDYFLAGKPFIAGETASIADLICVCTLEQTAAAGKIGFS